MAGPRTLPGLSARDGAAMLPAAVLADLPEATDYIEPDEVFPGATDLSVMVFPAATPGGTVMYYAYADNTRLDISIPVPIG